MIEVKSIRAELMEIRYYYSRKAFFDKTVGQVNNTILDIIKKYNEAVRTAPARLYDLYISLYLGNHTQETLAELLGYSTETISRLNRQLVKFLQKTFSEQVA